MDEARVPARQRVKTVKGNVPSVPQMFLRSLGPFTRSDGCLSHCHGAETSQYGGLHLQ